MTARIHTDTPFRQSPLPATQPGRVRVVTWLAPAVADKLDVAAMRSKLSSSGYIAAALTRHCAALDLFAEGVGGHEIAKLLHMSYRDVMRAVGAQVDDAAKGRWP